MHFVTFVCILYNMHQDTKSARLIAVCKRTVPLTTLQVYRIADYFYSQPIDHEDPQSTVCQINIRNYYIEMI